MPTRPPVHGRSAGLPSSWAAATELLSTVAATRPATIAPINQALMDAATPGAVNVDLSGLWVEPAVPSAARSNMVIRRLDDKGRLIVPLEPSVDLRLRAGRSGSVLTLFLPDAADGPAVNELVASVPLRTKGRITLPSPIRAQLGLAPNADVLVVFDPDRRNLRICPASHLEEAVVAALDQLSGLLEAGLHATDRTGPDPGKHPVPLRPTA